MSVEKYALDSGEMEVHRNGGYVLHADYEELERYGRQADITIENLEQKLADSQREFRAADANIENLQMKLAQMAAENAALKALCEDRRTFIINGVQLGYIKVPTVETDPALETIRVAVSPQATTAYTDAFLAEVRAQGADECVRQLVTSDDDDFSDAPNICAMVAYQLRKGVI